jgi:hypothetical protein
MITYLNYYYFCYIVITFMVPCVTMATLVAEITSVYVVAVVTRICRKSFAVRAFCNL